MRASPEEFAQLLRRIYKHVPGSHLHPESGRVTQARQLHDGKAGTEKSK